MTLNKWHYTTIVACLTSFLRSRKLPTFFEEKSGTVSRIAQRFWKQAFFPAAGGKKRALFGAFGAKKPGSALQGRPDTVPFLTKFARTAGEFPKNSALAEFFQKIAL